MDIEQIYIEGFIKRAAEYGLSSDEALTLLKAAEKPGLWANIRAKRARGEKPAKPGDKDYPDRKQWKRLTKDAASKLRNILNIARVGDPSGIHSYQASIGNNRVGRLMVSNIPGQGLTIRDSYIYPKYRKMGLGKKLYGEVMRRQPDGILNSDRIMVSPDAQRVWNSFKNNDSYNVTQIPGIHGDPNFPSFVGQLKHLAPKTAANLNLIKSAVAAWQRSEGKNPEGGLNAKGRASYKKETGGTLKAPVTESNPKGERAKRQNSFCSRMCGMKRVNTGAKAKSDPDSRINKSLRKWNCKCGEDHSSIMEKLACSLFK